MAVVVAVVVVVVVVGGGGGVESDFIEHESNPSRNEVIENERNRNGILGCLWCHCCCCCFVLSLA